MQTSKNNLKIEKLSIEINNKKILKNITFQAKTGDVIAILGPNGAGKSTLLKTIMHHYSTKISSGFIKFNNQELNNLNTEEIANLGFFLSFQTPVELEGVPMIEFFRNIINNQKSTSTSFLENYQKINNLFKKVDLDSDLIKQNVNIGFSGGQKKKNEILQMLLLEPSVVLLDEIDSGLDVDASKKIGKIINERRQQQITLIISHNLEFLNVVIPNKIIVLINGQVSEIGDLSLLNEIKHNGFKKFIK